MPRAGPDPEAERAHAMKDSLAPGISVTRRVTVDRDRTIGFMGEALRVYATPSLVHDLEYTCRDFLLEHLEDGKDTVGARVEVDHTAPTLLGMWADISVTVTSVEGPKVELAFTVRDSVEEVAKGIHRRFVVDVAKTEQRLQAKADKAKALS